MGVHNPHAKPRARKPLPPMTDDERHMHERRFLGAAEADRRAQVRRIRIGLANLIDRDGHGLTGDEIEILHLAREMLIDTKRI